MNDRNDMLQKIRDALGSEADGFDANAVYEALRADDRIYYDNASGLVLREDVDLLEVWEGISSGVEGRRLILALVAQYGSEQVEDQIKRWGNVLRASVDDDGDVWISSGGAGAWLDADKLVSAASLVSELLREGD